MSKRAFGTPEYVAFVAEMKSRILAARVSAARAVNRDLILLYWDIGHAIAERQQQYGWGDGVVERLAKDLQKAFPGVKGFSARNLWDMRRFFDAYGNPEILRQVVAELRKMTATDLTPGAEGNVTAPDREILRQVVPEVPWGQNLLILNKMDEAAARLYYLVATARFGWSRKVLLNQIKAGAYERSLAEGKTHNFPVALPKHLAEQAEEALKSSYNLEFLGIGKEVRESDLEARLIEQLRDFILELGYGFCFIGHQYRVTLGRKECFVDLLFYHRFLKALVAIELKVGPFEPEFAGKMDFYLNLLNERERGPDDNPSIGIILCAEKDNLEVEFALKTKVNPIGVAEYQLQAKLPKEYKGKLPTQRQLTDALRRKMAKETPGGE